jgi:hypothetical protein
MGQPCAGGWAASQRPLTGYDFHDGELRLLTDFAHAARAMTARAAGYADDSPLPCYSPSRTTAVLRADFLLIGRIC